MKAQSRRIPQKLAARLKIVLRHVKKCISNFVTFQNPVYLHFLRFLIWLLFLNWWYFCFEELLISLCFLCIFAKKTGHFWFRCVFQCIVTLSFQHNTWFSLKSIFLYRIAFQCYRTKWHHHANNCNHIYQQEKCCFENYCFLKIGKSFTLMKDYLFYRNIYGYSH